MQHCFYNLTKVAGPLGGVKCRSFEIDLTNNEVICLQGGHASTDEVTTGARAVRRSDYTRTSGELIDLSSTGGLT